MTLIAVLAIIFGHMIRHSVAPTFKERYEMPLDFTQCKLDEFTFLNKDGSVSPNEKERVTFAIVKKTGMYAVKKARMFGNESVLYFFSGGPKKLIIAGHSVCMPAGSGDWKHFDPIEEELRLTRATEFPLVVHMSHYCEKGQVKKTPGKPDETLRFVYMAVDYAPNGTFKELVAAVGPMDVWMWRFYLAQVVAAVDYLHSNNVAHRDIKDHNIMIDLSGNIKLIDLGNSILFTADTREFEYPYDKGQENKYNEMCKDIGEIGKLVTQQPTGSGSTELKAFEKVLKDAWYKFMGFDVSHCSAASDLPKMKNDAFFKMEIDMPGISIPANIKDKSKVTNGYESKGEKWVSKIIDWTKISDKKVAPPFSVCRKPPVNGKLTYCKIGGNDYDLDN